MTKNYNIDGDTLKACQYTRSLEIGGIVIGFILYEIHVDVIYTLFYKHQDVLLLTKTEFRTSLIFYLPYFMTPTTDVV